MTTAKARPIGRQKMVKCGDVQAGTPVQVGGEKQPNSLITMVRGHNVQALSLILRQSLGKCPSGSRFLKDIQMDCRVDYIWLPLDRVAMLLGKNLKTSRRMVAAGKLIALKHQIPTKNGATIKTFVLATEEIIQAEYDRFRDSLRKPELYFEETIDLGEHSYPSVFLVYYENGKDLAAKVSEKAGGSDVSL